MDAAPMSAIPKGAEAGPPPREGQEVTVEGLFPTPLTTIVGAVDGELVMVEAPRVGGVEVPLALDRPFSLTYRVREVRCEVPATVETSPSSGVHAYGVRMTGPPVRIQRRQEVRVPVRLQTILRRPAEAGDDDRRLSATTVDLSTGGLQLACDGELPPRETLSCLLNCGELGMLEMTITVVRCVRDTSAHNWHVGARIDDIDPEDRRTLSRYILDRQRILRRRELGLD
jgi:hypothetical protein